MVWKPFGKKREARLEALDRWRTARRLASSDVTDLGERLAVGPVGHEASHHLSSAVELHARAHEVLRSSTTAEDVFAVEPLLVDARYHLVAARAVRRRVTTRASRAVLLRPAPRAQRVRRDVVTAGGCLSHRVGLR